ncbi:hypothetical protein HMPREF1550_00391 [Actinomyces sp. oral taxon 877 str. F0543]|nr:hypothetical protein HMPREF1550_00391 [Actinomyces sp. oral taxon 877 str. F0543]
MRTGRVDRRVDRRHWGGSRPTIPFGCPCPSLREGNEERRARQ